MSTFVSAGMSDYVVFVAIGPDAGVLSWTKDPLVLVCSLLLAGQR
jgi:hypothetical protein